MPNLIKGVSFIHKDNYAVCHIENFSIELKDIIKKQLASVCYGTALSKEEPEVFNYKETLNHFMERFITKTIDTQKGMIGELLVHILIFELFSKFETFSPYFNMEEKSIRKGFDLILYDNVLKDVWITEVKSGELHKDKCSDQTTQDLLSTAHSDLIERLNEQKSTYWTQAIYSTRGAVEDERDCKKIVQKILSNEVRLVGQKIATSQDNNVILVSVLFENLQNRLQEAIPKEFSENPKKQQNFKKLIVLSIQKGTYQNVVDFFKDELA